jgi:hypothetical protein
MILSHRAPGKTPAGPRQGRQYFIHPDERRADRSRDRGRATSLPAWTMSCCSNYAQYPEGYERALEVSVESGPDQDAVRAVPRGVRACPVRYNQNGAVRFAPVTVTVDGRERRLALARDTPATHASIPFISPAAVLRRRRPQQRKRRVHPDLQSDALRIDAHRDACGVPEVVPGSLTSDNRQSAMIPACHCGCFT